MAISTMKSFKLNRLGGTALFLLACLLTATSEAAFGAGGSKRLTSKEKKEKRAAEAQKYIELRRGGQDEVGHTPEAAALRNYQLRKKKRKGLLRKRQADLASVLFPGVSPEIYDKGEEVLMYTDLVNSKKTSVPFDFYKLPGKKKNVELENKIV
jgi:hypothetical protein